jgi:hypothetical protein
MGLSRDNALNRKQMQKKQASACQRPGKKGSQGERPSRKSRPPEFLCGKREKRKNLKIMKKIITLCIVSILMSAAMLQASNNGSTITNPGPSASYSVWIKIIINFHRPKTNCESGFGICLDFEVGTAKATGSGAGLCPAQARINDSGQLEIMVSEADLLNYENGFALTYFRKGAITLDDPYTFSGPTSRLLNFDRQVLVKAGTYPVVYDASSRTYTVTFPI